MVDDLLFLLKLLYVLLLLVLPQVFEHIFCLLVCDLVSLAPHRFDEIHERLVVPVFKKLHFACFLVLFIVAPSLFFARYSKQRSHIEFDLSVFRFPSSPMYFLHVQIELCLSLVHEERVDLDTLRLFAAVVDFIEVVCELIEVFVVDVREVRLAEFTLFMVPLEVDSKGIEVEVVLVAEIAERVVDQQVLALV